MVRHCHALEEFETCMGIEREVWAAADIDLVPLPIFVVMAHTGGQILGAFDGARMVGFTLAFPAYQHGRLLLHSHMTAVIEGYRDKGVGRRLKLFQREDALSRGIELVEWTFDPLELKNAYFNLERLGAVVREFLPNAYGITTSPLHAGMPTDRLMAQWWLRSPRVEERVSGAKPRKALSGRVVRIAVPQNIREQKDLNPEGALSVQTSLRQQFLEWLGRGYVVTGIEMGESAGTYLLEPAEDVKDL